MGFGTKDAIHAFLISVLGIGCWGLVPGDLCARAEVTRRREGMVALGTNDMTRFPGFRWVGQLRVAFSFLCNGAGW
jgi:hypothetical protein